MPGVRALASLVLPLAGLLLVSGGAGGGARRQSLPPPRERVGQHSFLRCFACRHGGQISAHPYRASPGAGAGGRGGCCGEAQSEGVRQAAPSMRLTPCLIFGSPTAATLPYPVLAQGARC